MQKLPVFVLQLTLIIVDTSNVLLGKNVCTYLVFGNLGDFLNVTYLMEFNKI